MSQPEIGIAAVVEGQEGVTWSEWIRLAERCETAGIDALFTSDHYLSEVNPSKRSTFDAWTVIAALAAITERVRLGTAVSPVTLRHPAALAKIVSTVDHISGGRVELGLGMGWYEREHLAHGFPFPPARDRALALHEHLAIVRGLTADGPFEYESSNYRLVECPGLPKPVQDRLPIIVGGTGRPATVNCAAEFADEYNSLDSTTDGLLRIRARLDQACELTGRDPETLAMSLSLKCVIGLTDQDVNRRLERAHELLMADSPLDRPDISEGWLVGTTDHATAQLKQLATLGVNRVFLRFVDPTDLDALDLLGNEVIPACAQR